MNAVAMMFMRFAGFGRVILLSSHEHSLPGWMVFPTPKPFGKSHGYSIFGGMWIYDLSQVEMDRHTSVKINSIGDINIISK